MTEFVRTGNPEIDDALARCENAIHQLTVLLGILDDAGRVKEVEVYFTNAISEIERGAARLS